MTETEFQPIPPFSSLDKLFELVRLFESCNLPYAQWNHRAHLAVAAVYLVRYPLIEAIDRARTGIREYNRTRGNRTGYHETITIQFMRLVARQMRGVAVEELPALVDDLAARYRMDWLLRYYSAGRLWSAEARAEFVEPDLQPLPY